MGSIRDAGADTRKESSRLGTTEAIAHDARQPDIDMSPFGQQGQWSLLAILCISSQDTDAEVLDVPCANDMAGTASRSCAATRI
jgi:hypothetical protein